MTIDIYSSTGQKKGTMELPASLFGAPANGGLIHQAVILQQSNRRNAIAHSKEKWEIEGSTKKIYAQKGTGRARHGAIRGNVFRGGNKSFGPGRDANFTKGMPKMMRRSALITSLSLQAAKGAVMALESYPESIKTKQAYQLLEKLPVELGRPLLIVLPGKHAGLSLSVRNIPFVRAITAEYLNPEDVMKSRQLIFLVDAIKKAEEIFAAPRVKERTEAEVAAEIEKKPKNPLKTKTAKGEGKGTATAKKTASLKKTAKTSKTSKSSK